MRLLAFRKRLPCIDCKELSCVLYLFLGKTFQIYPAVCKGLCIIEFPVFHFCYLIQGHFHIWFRKLQENIAGAFRFYGYCAKQHHAAEQNHSTYYMSLSFHNLSTFLKFSPHFMPVFF